MVSPLNSLSSLSHLLVLVRCLPLSHILLGRGEPGRGTALPCSIPAAQHADRWPFPKALDVQWSLPSTLSTLGGLEAQPEMGLGAAPRRRAGSRVGRKGCSLALACSLHSGPFKGRELVLHNPLLCPAVLGQGLQGRDVEGHQVGALHLA